MSVLRIKYSDIHKAQSILLAIKLLLLWNTHLADRHCTMFFSVHCFIPHNHLENAGVLQMMELRLRGDTQIHQVRKLQSQNMNSVLSIARAHIFQILIHHVVQSSLQLTKIKLIKHTSSYTTNIDM